jgi:hypothetical protein
LNGCFTGVAGRMKCNLTEPMGAIVTIECNPEEVTVIVTVSQ